MHSLWLPPLNKSLTMGYKGGPAGWLATWHITMKRPCVKCNLYSHPLKLSIPRGQSLEFRVSMTQCGRLAMQLRGFLDNRKGWYDGLT